MPNDKNITLFSRQALRRYVGGYGGKSLASDFALFESIQTKLSIMTKL